MLSAAFWVSAASIADIAGAQGSYFSHSEWRENLRSTGSETVSF